MIVGDPPVMAALARDVYWVTLYKDPEAKSGIGGTRVWGLRSCRRESMGDGS